MSETPSRSKQSPSHGPEASTAALESGPARPGTLVDFSNRLSMPWGDDGPIAEILGVLLQFDRHAFWTHAKRLILEHRNREPTRQLIRKALGNPAIHRAIRAATRADDSFWNRHAPEMFAAAALLPETHARRAMADMEAALNRICAFPARGSASDVAACAASASAVHGTEHTVLRIVASMLKHPPGTDPLTDTSRETLFWRTGNVSFASTGHGSSEGRIAFLAKERNLRVETPCRVGNTPSNPVWILAERAKAAQEAGNEQRAEPLFLACEQLIRSGAVPSGPAMAAVLASPRLRPALADACRSYGWPTFYCFDREAVLCRALAERPDQSAEIVEFDSAFGPESPALACCALALPFSDAKKLLAGHPAEAKASRMSISAGLAESADALLRLTAPERCEAFAEAVSLARATGRSALASTILSRRAAATKPAPRKRAGPRT